FRKLLRTETRFSFFFQAEDGIRDFHVTGVQTCALPISPARQTASRPAGRLSQSLLSVLHLLAHLLDEDLHVDRAARGLEILGFRGERVGFAVELLHEEIEPASGGLAAADDAAHLRDVAGEPLELL